jgi:hypothetical protein
MPPKLKVKPPKDDEGGPPGGPPGVPPPNDGPGDVPVNINRRSKMTVRVPPGVPPPNDGGATNMKNGLLPTLAASARGCFGADVSFAAATSDSAPKQPSPYIDSLSALEQHVCRIAESHLESSFDLSRSTGYLAWKAKNGT